MAYTSPMDVFSDFDKGDGQCNIFNDHYATNAAARTLYDTPTSSKQMANQSTQPRQFINHIAIQVHLLACLKWLGEFQVLPLIPLCGSIFASDIAGLAGVPATQLDRVVRMTATAGFLCQSQLGEIAHTPLSRAFVVDLSLLDAVMFLAERATPTALSMTTATVRDGKRTCSADTAFATATNSAQSFQAACADEGRLRRQWSAFCQCAGDFGDSFIELLGRMNWKSLGNARVVDACAQSTNTATLLAEMYPNLLFSVQMAEIEQDLRGLDTRRISVQKKSSAGVQAVKDAAVYIVHLKTLRPALSGELQAELVAHLGVLQANPRAILIVAPPLLPEPGSVHPDVEATARLRDLSNIQLSNESAMDFSELVELISNVRDDKGRLTVVQKLRYRNELVAAVTVKYELYVNSASVMI